jgi:hypothetical protein
MGIGNETDASAAGDRRSGFEGKGRMKGYAAAFGLLLAVTGCYAGADENGSPLDTFGGTPTETGDAPDDDTAGEGDSGNSGGGDSGNSGEDDSGGDDSGGGMELEPLTTDEVRFYLGTLAPALAGRSLTYDENTRIQAEGEPAIEALIEEWTASPGFAESMRDMVQNELQASGERDGIDFELPGNLVAQVVGENLPWSTILTADYCVDADGAMIECDTGAPYEAGVLVTRAYLIPNKGRFNLTRALRMLEVFACRGYPMEPDIQIPVDKDIFIPMFRAQTPEEQTEEEALGGFGNGAGCYTCHSQFGAHAQFFVKFDDDGLWQADATGLQAEGLQENGQPYELGTSYNGLNASHFEDPADASYEGSQMFGENVANLREAAEVMAEHPLFYSCAAKNLIGHAFGRASGTSEEIAQDLVTSLAEDVMVISDDPTVREIAMTVFTNEEVIRAAVKALEE